MAKTRASANIGKANVRFTLPGPDDEETNAGERFGRNGIRYANAERSIVCCTAIFPRKRYNSGSQNRAWEYATHFSRWTVVVNVAGRT